MMILEIQRYVIQLWKSNNLLPMDQIGNVDSGLLTYASRFYN